MATLKSIKNKYLSASDGTALGVTTNTENVSLLAFKLATADSLSKFNLVDGFADDYNDATGVDASASTDASRNSTDNFYFGGSSAAATGGTVTTYGSYTVHTFTSSSAFVTPTAGTVDVLVVGNGGSGGTEGSRRGGGGGGGVIYGSDLAVDSGSRTVTFTSAGASGGGGGVNTIALTSTVTLSGGGGGGAGTGVPGGGSSHPSPTGGATGYQSGAGGNGSVDAGAGSPGGNGPANDYQTGVSQNYGGGGGGGHHHDDSMGAAPGGAGGGGDGGGAGTPGAQAGTAPFGGGGGGAGAAGAMGIVVIRYLASAFLSIDDMDLRSNAFTAQTAPTTARIILDEEDFTGTTTLNTDLKAYASRDNGTTFTQMTLASLGYLAPEGGMDTYTDLLMHCDGTNGGTTFTDATGNHTITNSGVTTTTADKKFGTASGDWDSGTETKNMYVDHTTGLDFDGAFTIDFWTKVAAATATLNNRWFQKGDNSATGYILGLDATTIYFGRSDENLVSFASNLVVATGNWHHIAITRQTDNYFRLYLDGALQATSGSTYNDNLNNAGALYLGAYPGDTSGDRFDGLIDEFRVSKGVARWTADFTPSNRPYSDGPLGPASRRRQLLSGSVDISGQPSGTNMKYKLTSHNQAAAKETRIYGTSMAWA